MKGMCRAYDNEKGHHHGERLVRNLNEVMGERTSSYGERNRLGCMTPQAPQSAINAGTNGNPVSLRGKTDGRKPVDMKKILSIGGR